MTRRELLLGWSYLLIAEFALSTILYLIGNLLGVPMSLATLNILYFVINFVCVVGIFHKWAGPDFSNVNDNAILELSQEHPGLFAFGTILLVPVAEEVIFRGSLFQGFYRNNRKFAFLLSVCCFAAIHIVDFIGQEDWKTLLFCFLQYLPAGIALANAYVASDTIIAPILMHITINLIAVTALAR